MAERDAVVKNAADPRQVARGKRLEKQQRDLELDDLRAVLQTAEGRRLLFRLMGHCRTFQTVWAPDDRIHYNAGQQDVGHFLIAEVTEADEAAFLLMMQESFAAAKLQRQQTDAERTPSVAEGEDDADN